MKYEVGSRHAATGSTTPEINIKLDKDGGFWGVGRKK